ncbi:MAG: hypothetical protein SchgKO_17810 [Schleiferiaceae bacterium]
MSNVLMVKRVGTLATLFFGFMISAVSAGISFESGSWSDVLQKAKAEDKLIFVDAYATWCGPCKTMSREVFTDEEVGAYFSENFVNYKYDMEKGEGIDFSEKYEVTAYPTLLLINSDGEVVSRKVGAMEAPSFLIWGKETLHPELSPLVGFKRDFEKGERDTTFLFAYLEALSERGEYEGMQPITKAYLKEINPSALVEVKPYVVFMYNETVITNNPHWEYFYSHYDEFVMEYGEYAYDKLSNTLEYNYLLAIEKEDEDLFKEIIEIVVWAEEPENPDDLRNDLWESYREGVESSKDY